MDLFFREYLQNSTIKYRGGSCNMSLTLIQWDVDFHSGASGGTVFPLVGWLVEGFEGLPF